MDLRAGAVLHGLIALATAMALALLLLPGAASATIYSGSSTDAVGDGPAQGQDLTSARTTYDDGIGKIGFEIRFAAAPSGELQVTTGLGHREADGTCEAPMLLIGAFLPDGSTVWILEQDGSSPAEELDDASRTLNGPVLNLKAADPRLKGFEPDCAEVVLSDPDDPATVYDSFSTFAVKPPPPKPKLKASIAPVGGLKRGAAKAVKVTVENPGTGTARGVVVRAKVTGNATLTPRVRKLGRMTIGKVKTVRFRVKAGRRGKGRVKVSVRVTGRQVKTAAATTFRIRLPRKPVKPSSGGLAGKVFWGFETGAWDHSPDLVFLHFTNRKFVYWGIPRHGLVNCRRVTARMKKGEMQPGCLRYRYNKRSGTVRIGKVRGTFRRGNLKLKMDADVFSTDGKSWFAAVIPRRGTRFKTELINRGYRGTCGPFSFCSTWSEYLVLTRDGRFGRTGSSITTSGTPGGIFTAISSLGPDEKGRYKVLGGGRIRFNYADGHKTTEMIVVQTNKRGRPDPVREGLLVGDLWFYKED